MVRVYKKNGETRYDISEEAKETSKWFKMMDKEVYGRKKRK